MSFVVVNLGYLAATCADSLLPPIFPAVARDLGIGLDAAGFAFALLAGSIAIGNVAGGFLLTRAGPRAGAILGLTVAAAGGLLAAASRTGGPFLAAQTLLGGGSGLYFASGLWSAAGLAAGRRRGLAMGFFGIAFSGGLAAAALLAALGSVHGHRVTFAVSAALSATAALAVLPVHLPPRPVRRHESTAGWHRALGMPLAVGGTAAASQYGTISFLPTFAVSVWGMSPSAAAVVLAVSRVLSVPAKLAAGHRSDRAGALVTAGQIGFTLGLAGAAWSLGPTAAVGVAPAIAFAALVSGLGPVTNVLALDAFGERGVMLGLFRSLQIALGAVTSAAIGLGTSLIGLRPTLVVAAVLPAGVALLARRSRHRAKAVAAERSQEVIDPGPS